MSGRLVHVGSQRIHQSRTNINELPPRVPITQFFWERRHPARAPGKPCQVSDHAFRDIPGKSERLVAIEPELVRPLIAQRLKQLARRLQMLPLLHCLDVFESAAGVIDPFKQQGKLIQANFEANGAASFQVLRNAPPLATGLLIQTCKRVADRQIDRWRDGQAVLTGQIKTRQQFEQLHTHLL